MIENQTDCERFIRFMKQSWSKPFKQDVTVYALQAPGCLPFYVGVTQDPERRKREHEEEAFLPANISSLNELMQIFISKWAIEHTLYGACKMLKQSITGLMLAQGQPLVWTPLETIRAKDYAYTWEEKKAMPLREYLNNPRFSQVVLERERRWIFRLLQEGCGLTNVEVFCDAIIQAVRAHPQLDILNTPFSSPAWGPIIKAYTQDEPDLREYNIM